MRRREAGRGGKALEKQEASRPVVQKSERVETYEGIQGVERVLALDLYASAVEAAAKLDDALGGLGLAPCDVDGVGVDLELRAGVEGVEDASLGEDGRPLLVKRVLELVGGDVELVGRHDRCLGRDGVVCPRRARGRWGIREGGGGVSQRD